MPEKPLDLHPPIRSPIDEAYDSAQIPIGFEGLSRGVLKDMMGIAGFDLSDYRDFTPLSELPVDRLRELRKAYVTAYRRTTPDGCKRVETVIKSRIALIEEAARSSGGKIPDSEEAERLVADIRESQHTPKKPVHPSIDSLIQADWVQVPKEEADAEIEEVIGRFSGPDMNVAGAIFDKPMFSVVYRRSKNTQYIQVVKHGAKVIMPWNKVPEKIRANFDYERIQQIKIPLKVFREQLEGFGETMTPEGQQFRNAQKQGRARRTHWQAGKLIPPQVRTK